MISRDPDDVLAILLVVAVSLVAALVIVVGVSVLAVL